MLPWFFMFLEIYKTVFTFEVVSSLVFISWKWNPFHPPCWGIWDCLRPVNTPASSFLLPHVAEFFSLNAFFQSCSSLAKCWQFPFVSPKMMLKLKLAVFSWPTVLSFLYMLTSHLPKLALTATIRSSHRELATEGRCGSMSCAERRHACGPAVQICGQGISSSLLVSFSMKSTTQLVGFLSLKWSLWVLSSALPVSSHP